MHKELNEGTSDHYDSHPSLAARLAALQGAPHTPPMVPDPPAIELLDRLSPLETELMHLMTSKEVALYAPIEWDRTTDLWLELWYEQCRSQRHVLEGMTVRQLPDVAAAIGGYASRVRTSGPKQSHMRVFLVAVGEALTVILSRRGWTIESVPGEPVKAKHGDASIETFDVLPRLVQNSLTREEWERTCAAFGIGDFDLGDATYPAGDEPRAVAPAIPEPPPAADGGNERIQAGST
jgi:hypothetical protein